MTKEQEIVKEIVEILNNNNLTPNNTIAVVSDLLFSIGASLEQVEDISSEDVIKNFANTPTLGNALMAQALHMKETWTDRKET